MAPTSQTPRPDTRNPECLFIFLLLILSTQCSFGQNQDYNFDQPAPDSLPHATQKYRELAFSTGVWVPSGPLQILGNHPSAGAQLNFWINQWLIGADLHFRFIKSANEYTVMYQGKPTITDTFLGGHIGMKAGYAFLNSKSNSLYGLVGLGYDGFDCVDIGNTVKQQNGGVGPPTYAVFKADKAQSINAFSANIGIGFRHFGKKGTTLGLEVIENFHQYDNLGGTSMDGSSLTVQFIIGFLTDYPLSNQ